MPDAAPAAASAAPAPAAATEGGRVRSFLLEAQELERTGCVNEALERYEFAITMAEEGVEKGVQAEALRRFGVLLHRRGVHERARALAERSLDVATSIASPVLAAEALNTLGVMALQTSDLTEADLMFERALIAAGNEMQVRARIEQNLGILANIRGDLDGAFRWYRLSLDAYRNSGDVRGCAMAHHNLGMACADRERFAEAERNFLCALALAVDAGDVLLRALCLSNLGEVHVARQQYSEALDSAEQALALFDQIREAAPRSTAYRVIGMVYRETGRPELAESRLRTAIEIGARTSSFTNEADAMRELALLLSSQGRNGEALRLLGSANALYGKLDARMDQAGVRSKIADLQEAYVAVARDWGRSLESHDAGTYGHSERVAELSIAVAQRLGMDDEQQTTIVMGAFLHDIGKVRVPGSILRKETALDAEELALARMHPVWGAELLDDVEFPWDIKPIVRWHHERRDGSGYPDMLRGDAIPLGAQLVGLVEAYDTLTTTRVAGARLEPMAAVARLLAERNYWSPLLLEAFAAAVRERATGAN